ncbi:MAG: c-type cytochrome biogenesis protein CcmI [Gammaproteobacteria bacterium]|jgi:cytochrome c-type biogenesis protein CcmH
MAFYIIAVAMLLIAGLIVALPLLRQRHVADRGEQAVEATEKAQLADLERDREQGLIDDRAYEAARKGLEAEFSRTRPQRSGTDNSSGRAHWAALLGGMAVPVLAGLLYFQFGDFQAAVGNQQGAEKQSVEAMVNRLAARLKENPDDLKGWLMLGRSYVVMSRYDDAVNAYGHALDLAGDSNADVLADYAEAMALANPHALTGRAAPLLRRVLVLDPDNAKGLWYGGLMEYQAGDYDKAIANWQKLLAQNPPAGFRRLLADRINQARKAGGKAGPMQTASTPEKSAVAAGGGAGVKVSVSIAPELKSAVKPGDTVFIFAQAGQGGGPPLAVKRLSAGQLPVSLTLSDADSMVPGRNLSSVDKATIVARVSHSGTPLPQSGDLDGKTRVLLKNGSATAPVKVTIDTQVP